MDFSFYRQHRALLAQAISQPWAIQPEALPAILAGLQDNASYAAQLGAERQDDNAATKETRVGTLALIPVHGIITPRSIPFFEMCGATVSAGSIVSRLSTAIADPNIDAVVLSLDSPGGTVAGTLEAAQALEALRQESDKPIVAQVDYLASSGAYWIAVAAAHEIVTSLSGMTGSIGVVMAYESRARQMDAEGIDVEFITAGKYKAELNGVDPLTDGARDHLQGTAHYFYKQFAGAVANARGASVADVMNSYGEGRVLSAEAALKANMVDRIASMSETLERLSRPQSRAALMRRANPGLSESPDAPEATALPDAKEAAEQVSDTVEDAPIGMALDVFWRNAHG